MFPNDSLHPIGLNVRYHRKRLAMAIMDLSRKTGIPVEVLTSIEDYSRTTISAAEAQTLAAAFGIELDILLVNNPSLTETLEAHLMNHTVRKRRPMV